MTSSQGISRRNALVGVSAAGVAVPLLAACGDDSDGGGTGNDTASDPTSSANPGTPESSDSATDAPAAGLAATSDIEVGGGKIFGNENVVITQPKAGEFKGFSATCTHKGCPLASVSGGTINCDCHGSQFSIEDGSNTAGPNGEAAGSVDDLEEVKLTVNGDQISVS